VGKYKCDRCGTSFVGPRAPRRALGRYKFGKHLAWCIGSGKEGGEEHRTHEMDEEGADDVDRNNEAREESDNLEKEAANVGSEKTRKRRRRRRNEKRGESVDARKTKKPRTEPIDTEQDAENAELEVGKRKSKERGGKRRAGGRGRRRSKGSERRLSHAEEERTALGITETMQFFDFSHFEESD